MLPAEIVIIRISCRIDERTVSGGRITAACLTQVRITIGHQDDKCLLATVFHARHNNTADNFVITARRRRTVSRFDTVHPVFHGFPRRFKIRRVRTAVVVQRLQAPVELVLVFVQNLVQYAFGNGKARFFSVIPRGPFLTGNPFHTAGIIDKQHDVVFNAKLAGT